MDAKAELSKLIQQLPEDKIAAAIERIKELNEEAEIGGGKTQDPLFDVIKAMIYSMNNSLYDLSIEAGRRDERVLANRLESYRKRVTEAWETYKK